MWTTIVLWTRLVRLRNVWIHADQPAADVALCVRLTTTSRAATVRPVCRATRTSSACSLSAEATWTARQTRSAICHRTNACRCVRPAPAPRAHDAKPSIIGRGASAIRPSKETAMCPARNPWSSTNPNAELISTVRLSMLVSKTSARILATSRTLASPDRNVQSLTLLRTEPWCVLVRNRLSSATTANANK